MGVRMLSPSMPRSTLGLTEESARAPFAWRHSLHLVCLAVFVAFGLLTATGATPDLVEAAGKISKKDLKESCLKAPGSHWHESGDGSYGCWIGGFRTECDRNGNCTQYCYEEFGCTCEEMPAGVNCVRKNSTSPRGPVLPGQSSGDQGPVYTDPAEPTPAPSPRPRSPGDTVPADDEVKDRAP